MSDSCDITAGRPKEKTETLDRLTREHRAVARYSIARTEKIVYKRVETIIAKNLPYNKAKQAADELMKEELAKNPDYDSWIGPMWHLRLENPEETRRVLCIPTLEDRIVTAKALGKQ